MTLIDLRQRMLTSFAPVLLPNSLLATILMTLHAALNIISRFVDLCFVFWRATVYEAAAKRVRTIFWAAGLIFG